MGEEQCEWEFLKLSQKVLYILKPFHTLRIPEDEGVVHSNIEFSFKIGCTIF